MKDKDWFYESLRNRINRRRGPIQIIRDWYTDHKLTGPLPFNSLGSDIDSTNVTPIYLATIATTLVLATTIINIPFDRKQASLEQKVNPLEKEEPNNKETHYTIDVKYLEPHYHSEEAKERFTNR